MKRIKIHIIAFAIFLPLITIFSEGNLAINLFGIIYAFSLFWLSKTTRGKQFIRSYHKEVCRIENSIK